MSTTVFATKRALRDLLKTSPDLPGPISYADPGNRRRTAVWLGPDVEDVEGEAVALRPKTNRRNEDYRLSVFVEVTKPGNVENAEKAAETLVNAILAAVDDAPDLNKQVPGLLWIVGEGMDVSTTETTDGPRVTVEIYMRVRARP